MPAIDNFSTTDEVALLSGISPASGAEAVTPHDTNELVKISREIYIGGTGNIAVVMKDGSEATFVNVPAGSRLPYRVKQVKATNTTATNIVSVY